MPYRAAMGSVDKLCREAARWLTPAQLAQGRARQHIAGRVLLAKAVCRGMLADIHTGENGKPCFTEPGMPYFNISHSGENVLLLVCEQGEVGCDLEMVRPRPRWRRIAGYGFSAACLHWLMLQPEPVDAFWQLWTWHEAILKQRGGSVWQMSALQLEGPTATPPGLYCHSMRSGNCRIALCGIHPFPKSLTIDSY